MNPKYIIGIAAAAVIILTAIIWVASSPSASSPNDSAKETELTPPPAQTAETSPCESKKLDVATLKNAPVPDGDTAEFSIRGFGNIHIKLDQVAAPKTVENFKKLVAAGFYDCLLFHRIAPSFVIQGGDPRGDGTGGPGYTVPAEIKLKHKRGSVAMARLPDAVNPKQESSGSQFYIALQDLGVLDGQYTVFGEVVHGMDVVDAISQVELAQPQMADGPPKDKVIIEKAVMLNPPPAPQE